MAVILGGPTAVLGGAEPLASQLLRMKCEAYSTLNESDEDPSAEDRIQARFAQSVATPPDGALLPPAALYLTAILEYEIFFSSSFGEYLLNWIVFFRAMCECVYLFD